MRCNWRLYHDFCSYVPFPAEALCSFLSRVHLCKARKRLHSRDSQLLTESQCGSPTALEPYEALVPANWLCRLLHQVTRKVQLQTTFFPLHALLEKTPSQDIRLQDSESQSIRAKSARATAGFWDPCYAHLALSHMALVRNSLSIHLQISKVCCSARVRPPKSMRRDKVGRSRRSSARE